MASSGLGNLLVKEGFLSETDRRMIAKTCGHNSWAFAKAILTTGLLDEDELVAFLADKTHFEVAPRDFLDQIDESILDRVDITLFSRLEVLPIFMDSRHIQVAAVDPLDRDTVRQIEFFTDLKVICWLAPISHIYLGIKSFIPNFQPKQTLIGDFLEHHATTIFYGKNHTPSLELSQTEDDIEEISNAIEIDVDMDSNIDEALESSLPSFMDTFAEDDFSDISEEEPSETPEEALDVDLEDPNAQQEEYAEDDMDLDEVGSEIEDASKSLEDQDELAEDTADTDDLDELGTNLEADNAQELESIDTDDLAGLETTDVDDSDDIEELETAVVHDPAPIATEDLEDIREPEAIKTEDLAADLADIEATEVDDLADLEATEVDDLADLEATEVDDLADLEDVDVDDLADLGADLEDVDVDDLGDLEADLEDADVDDLADLGADLEDADVNVDVDDLADLGADLEDTNVDDLADLGADLKDADVDDLADNGAEIKASDSKDHEVADDLDIVAEDTLEAIDNLDITANDDLDIVTDNNLEDTDDLDIVSETTEDIKDNEIETTSNLEKDLADDLAGINIDDIGSDDITEDSLDSFDEPIETENPEIESKLDNVDDLDIGDFDKEDDPIVSKENTLEELDLGDEAEEKKETPISTPSTANFPKSAESKASPEDLNALNKLHLKLMLSSSKEKSLKLAEKYMSGIYPDTEIVDLNTKESLKSWLSSSANSFVELNNELFEKLESLEPLSWVEISENVWATSNQGKASKIAMLTKISPDNPPCLSTLQETSTILQSISSQT